MTLFEKYESEMDQEVLISEDRVQLYIRLREEGMTPRGADMLASQRGPSLSGADTALFRGRVNGNQFENCPFVGEQYKQLAESRRPGCTKGAVYMTQLAKNAGDPDAWVKSTADMKCAAEIKGADIEDGIVKYKCKREVKPKDPVPLAPSIVRQELLKKAILDPSLRESKKRRANAVAEIYDKHTPSWKKKLLKG